MEHDIHRQRRNAINSFFSTASIRRLEPILRKGLGKMLSRLEQSGKNGEVVAMHHVFKALTSDVINVYAFDASFDFLSQPAYGRGYFDATDLFFSLNHVFCYFPFVAFLVQSLPPSLVGKLMPTLNELFEKKNVRFGHVLDWVSHVGGMLMR